MSSDRYFEPSIPDTPYRLPLDLWQQEVTGITTQLLRHRADSSVVYTGSAGVAYALLRLATCKTVPFPIGETRQMTRQEIWDALLDHIGEALDTVHRSSRRHGWSFICGLAGVYATGALIFHEAAMHRCSPTSRDAQDPEHFQRDLVQRRDEMLSVFKDVGMPLTTCSETSFDFPQDEVLYGRAGYLLGSLHLCHISPLLHDINRSIVQALLLTGKAQSQRQRHPCPLYYEWPYGHHPKPYLGAAHGLIGILYALLHFREVLEELGEELTVLQATRYVLQCEVDAQGRHGKRGYYPTSLHSQRSPLVHWCHGSCGAVFLFSKACEIFRDEDFLQAAVRAAEVVWKKGLLRKGPGLCHGVSGNGYALLKLYKITMDEKYLTRASRFAEFMFSERFRFAHVPDRPWSLYEGWAGALCFLLDLRDPTNATFPFFEP